MKRSEFAAIVNQVAHEETDKLQEALLTASHKEDQPLAEMIATLASSIPGIAARTTAEMLIRSGVISFEEE